MPAEFAVIPVKKHTIGRLATIFKLPNPIMVASHESPQIEITLKILRTSRRDVIKSAYTTLNGRKFDWNKTPMAPDHNSWLCIIGDPHVSLVRSRSSEPTNSIPSLAFLPQNYHSRLSQLSSDILRQFQFSGEYLRSTLVDHAVSFTAFIYLLKTQS